MSEKVLHTENLSIGYHSKKGDNLIAANVDVSLYKGKLVSLIGANGIGKSTLLRTLTGIQKPLSGKVWLNGNPINEQSAGEIARQLSMVLTEKLPPSNLTVFELVALGRQPYTNWIGTLTTADRDKIDLAMRLTQIEHLSDRKHYEISDGQLQKVLIARALAQDTPLIVLDEPSTHLDLLHKVSLLRLLTKLTRETGKCILFSTHDIDLAVQTSDEMIVMTAGKIMQDSPEKLIKDGIFDLLFGSEQLIFDSQKGRFVLKAL